MSWARYEVLELLTRKGPMSYRELAESLVRHRTSIKTTVASLTDAGYVSISRDRRWTQRLLVESTDAGIRAVHRAEAAFKQHRLFEADIDQSHAVYRALVSLELAWTNSAVTHAGR